MQRGDVLVISLCCEAYGVRQCLDIFVRVGEGYILQAATGHKAYGGASTRPDSGLHF
jgi:hypothetical protein